MREHGEIAPAVLSPETVESVDADEHIPDTVYLPSERVTRRDQEVTLELRRVTDGSIAMLAYTTLENLVESCGNQQPWVAVRGDWVEELRERSGADLVVWDAAIPVEERRSGVVEGQ